MATKPKPQSKFNLREMLHLAPNTLQRLFPPGPKTDLELLASCKSENTRGAQDAWERLVGLYYKRVYRVPRNLGLSPQDAEDITQNTFIALYRNINTIREDVDGWLVRVAHNKSVDLIRSRKPTVELDEYLPSPLDISKKIELQEQIALAFTMLSREEQRVMRELLKNADAADAEISVILGKSEASVKKTRQRAFEKLRAARENASKL